MPRSVVTDGSWKLAWRVTGKRGGGALASLLPVLALHSYPNGPSHDEGPGPTSDASLYSSWASLSIRRMAKLAGLNKDTAWRALQTLVGIGWGEFKTLPVRSGMGGKKSWFRLSTKLFASEAELYAHVPGSLIYSGNWMMLPTAASRYLFLTLAALDPIHNEKILLEVLNSDPDSEHEEVEQRIRRMRERNTVSWAELIDVTGFSRTTLRDTLSILTAPVFPDQNPTIPFIRWGGRLKHPRWYAVEKPAIEVWHWKLDVVNNPNRVAAVRRRAWPTAGITAPRIRRLIRAESMTRSAKRTSRGDDAG